MKAPDKIWVTPVRTWDTKPIPDLTDIIYIRKDALLKWAKEKQYESLTIVADNFWQEVINKLNSL